MNVYDLLPDPRIMSLFRGILESGGLIHGGCIRDLFHKEDYIFHDIDIYFSNLNGFSWDKDKLDYRFICFLSNLVAKQHSLQDTYLEQVDGDLNNSGYFLPEFKNCKLRVRRYPWDKPEVLLDIIYRPAEFTAKNNFLDFDINSLYVLPDGTLSSSLGADKVELIIDRIKNNQCKLMRADVPEARIKHILDKGFKCNLIPFL